jgi:general secretion pathway protein L
MIQRNLLLRLPEHDGPAAFVLRDSAGSLLMSGSDALSRLAERARSVPVPTVRVLVPGARVLLTRAKVPTRNPRALLRALPYALEDQLAGDVEALHCVPGPVAEDNTVPVAVVERALMDDWRARLGAAGLDVRALVPETAVLPRDEEGGWLLWLEGDEAWLAVGPGEGLALDRDNAAMLVRMRLDETPDGQRPARVVVVRHGPARESDNALDEPEVFGDVPVVHQESEEPLLEAISLRLPARPPFNLLVGPYGRREQWSHLWRPWRVAVVIAVLWGAVQLIQLHTEIRYMGQEQALLDQRMRDIYQAAFPGSRAGSDPRRQMEGALASLTRGGSDAAGHDFQAALAHVAPVLVEVPGFRIEGLRYRPGQMDLDLRLDSLQALDGLRQRLEREDQWSVEILSASAQDDYVESRIQLRRAGS